MKVLLRGTLVAIAITVTGCATSVGNSRSGYQDVEGAKIQPAEAVKLAEPHLDRTIELRQAHDSLSREGRGEPTVFVTLKRRYYYVVKENYPFIIVKSATYLRHAVKVHKKTGKVIPPT